MSRSDFPAVTWDQWIYALGGTGTPFPGDQAVEFSGPGLLLYMPLVARD